jgi:uncharacterized surface protein with fasciclin (FAS1) repeats
MMKCASKMTMGMMRMATGKKAWKSCGQKVRKQDDVIDTLHELGNFKTLRAALDATALTSALRAEGPYTLFAPTDEAFAKLPAGAMEELLKDIPKLKKILSRHVVAGLLKPEGWMETISVKTIEGEPLRIAFSEEKMTVGQAEVKFTNISAVNGLIHVIDAVLPVE